MAIRKVSSNCYALHESQRQPFKNIKHSSLAGTAHARSDAVLCNNSTQAWLLKAYLRMAVLRFQFSIAEGYQTEESTAIEIWLRIAQLQGKKKEVLVLRTNRYIRKQSDADSYLQSVLQWHLALCSFTTLAYRNRLYAKIKKNKIKRGRGARDSAEHLTTRSTILRITPTYRPYHADVLDIVDTHMTEV